MWAYILSFICLLFGWCEDGNCRQKEFRDVSYVICTYRTDEISIRLFQNDENGKPYGGLSEVSAHLEGSSNQPDMLMNGGMYHEDLQPVGLYVEEGETIQKISTKDGWGNFHLLPNGIFWVKGKKFGVKETRQFLKSKIKPDFATQSGPMLVINGKLHPRFIENSDSLKIRNGVGVSADGKKIYFAISKSSVNFWDFGSLFKDELKVKNALFLDGTVSSIRTEKFRQGGWRELGPIIAVFTHKSNQ